MTDLPALPAAVEDAGYIFPLEPVPIGARRLGENEFALDIEGVCTVHLTKDGVRALGHRLDALIGSGIARTYRSAV